MTQASFELLAGCSQCSAACWPVPPPAAAAAAAAPRTCSVLTAQVLLCAVRCHKAIYRYLAVGVADAAAASPPLL